MAGKAEVIRRANELLTECGAKSKALQSAQFDMIFRAIYELVRDGERVSVQHFGAFVRVKRAPRRGWDSTKNEPTQIPASTRLMFRTKIRFETPQGEDRP